MGVVNDDLQLEVETGKKSEKENGLLLAESHIFKKFLSLQNTLTFSFGDPDYWTLDFTFSAYLLRTKCPVLAFF